MDAASPRFGVSEATRGALLGLLDFAGRWRRRRALLASLRSLLALDDRLLRDVGLMRGEVIDAVEALHAAPFWRSPRPGGRDLAMPSHGEGTCRAGR